MQEKSDSFDVMERLEQWKVEATDPQHPNYGDADLNQPIRHYTIVSRMLEKLRTTPESFTQQDVAELFGGLNSGQRMKNKVAEENPLPELRRQLLTMLDGDGPPSAKIEAASRSIKYAGPNMLGELYGWAHADTAPLYNQCATGALAYLGYEFDVNDYDAFVAAHEQFKQVYQQRVGHLKPDLPLNLEIDKFYNVIDKVDLRQAPIATFAPPFDKLFQDWEEAEWAFELLAETFGRLGVTGPDDERYALTLRRDGSVLRLNFGNWAVLSFYAPGTSAYRLELPLVNDLVELDCDYNQWTPFAAVDPSISGYDLPVEAVMPLEGKLRRVFEQTLPYVSNRFKDWSRSPFRGYNQIQIAEAIFDPSRRAALLTEGVTGPAEPNIWWVNQGTTLQAEKEGGFLWAPIASKDERTIYHWEMLKDLREGDIILHYSNGYLRYASQVIEPVSTAPRPEALPNTEWQREGRLVRLNYLELTPPVPLQAFSQEIQQLDIPQGPINRTGGVKQAYLCRFSTEALCIVVSSHPDASWPSVVTSLCPRLSIEPQNPVYPLSECAAATGFEAADLERWTQAIERKGQGIIYGPPGTGKTYVAEHLARHLVGGGDGFWDLVQFHPAYAYEDFVQGIRPKAQVDGQLDYPVVPGRFLNFCEEAKGRQGRCVLIIDEINRANLARVFGELMYLLEYRDREVPLAAGGSLRIPKNVRILGTMNTADRSIALVDHALRRRFAFLALYPNYDLLRKYHQKTGLDIEPLISVLRKLNRQIGDRHYEVGITFFLRKDLEGQIEDIWTMEIEPYLEEYFFDQQDKVDAFRWEQVGKEIRF